MGLLADAFSYGNGLKRKVNGLLADPMGTLELGVTRLGEDQNKLLALMKDVMPAGRYVAPEVRKNALKELADYGSQVGMAGMFVGPKSQTWDKAAAAKAQELAKKGTDPRKIWSETGTWKGPDGMWRQEIPDNAAKFRRSNVSDPAQFADVFDEAASRTKGVAMSSALDHAPLYKAYPEQSATRFKVEGSGPSVTGSYQDADRMVSISDPYSAKMGDSAESVTLHELQHAIQQREGFAKGGSPGSNGLTWDELTGHARKTYENSANAYDDPLLAELFSGSAPLKPWDSMTKTERIPYYEQAQNGAYERLAGEAEARATQARMNMDAAQRRATFPEDSYDVPINSLILRGLLAP